MKLALDLAARGEGAVSPNPMVGAVLVKGGRIVGRGWHRNFGGPHAEIEALAQAGSRAKGSTAYVTLEPCAHEGRTGACALALIKAGVRRVEAAMADPDPRVQCRGFALLRQAGIKVSVGLSGKEALVLNESYVLSRREGRAFFHLKLALSQDLKLGPAGGRRFIFSSPASRVEAHRLRAWSDGVLIGVQTLNADNPDLSPRLLQSPRSPRPVVLDPGLRANPRSRCLDPQRRPLILCGDQASEGKRRILEDRGLEVLTLEAPGGRFRFSEVARLLYNLDLGRVMIEGGGRTAALALASGLVDKMTLFLTPHLFGESGVPAFPGLSRLPLRLIAVRPSGPDLALNYTV